MVFIISLLLGYFIGSIPFGLFLTRVAGYGDVRKIGSGNIGATNVLRTGNKLLALLTLILDGGKGAFAVFFGVQLILMGFPDLPAGQLSWAPLILGFSAILGHCFPVWLKFSGGKGVATTFGMLLVLNWAVGSLALLTWLIVAVLFRYSSLSALSAIALTPLSGFYFSGYELALTCFFVALIVFARHSSNIQRLMNGTETKIGAKKKS
jgi:glycerol-3-phosphate acyltransferase PlsY